jgi:ATP-dependent exoDNAse (exonuclease V) beta subunit
MVHKAIECWLFPGDEGFEGLLHTVALAEGLVEPHQQQEAVANASRLLGRLRTHPLWDEIAQADEHYHEVPYTRPLAGGRPDSGVLDLLYRIGQQWVLLDFKIDELRDDATAEAATIKYRGQMERYTQAARSLLGADVLPRLCYLDYCHEVRLVPL